VTEAQLIVPAPCSVAAVLALALFCNVIPAVTVRVIPELTVKVPTEVLALLNVIELIVSFAVTVTESPARMTTSSVDAGTPDGDQQLAVSQLHVPVLVLVAAYAGLAGSTASTSMTRTRAVRVLLAMDLKVEVNIVSSSGSTWNSIL
jgi:hypothetical protein